MTHKLESSWISFRILIMWPSIKILNTKTTHVTPSGGGNTNSHHVSQAQPRPDLSLTHLAMLGNNTWYQVILSQCGRPDRKLSDWKEEAPLLLVYFSFNNSFILFSSSIKISLIISSPRSSSFGFSLYIF